MEFYVFVGYNWELERRIIKYVFCGNYEMLFYGNYMILIVWDIWERKEYLGKCEVWFIIG